MASVLAVPALETAKVGAAVAYREGRAPAVAVKVARVVLAADRGAGREAEAAPVDLAGLVAPEVVRGADAAALEAS